MIEEEPEEGEIDDNEDDSRASEHQKQIKTEVKAEAN